MKLTPGGNKLMKKSSIWATKIKKSLVKSYLQILKLENKFMCEVGFKGKC